MGNTELMPTLWQDFSEAEKAGAKHIKETFTRLFTKWKYNHAYLVNLCIVLYNKVCFFTTNTQLFKPKQANEYSIIYLNLWRRADRFALDTLSSVELQYLYSITR